MPVLSLYFLEIMHSFRVHSSHFLPTVPCSTKNSLIKNSLIILLPFTGDGKGLRGLVPARAKRSAASTRTRVSSRAISGLNNARPAYQLMPVFQPATAANQPIRPPPSLSSQWLETTPAPRGPPVIPETASPSEVVDSTPDVRIITDAAPKSKFQSANLFPVCK